MRVVSLSVGRPREVEWHGRTVLTSIFKAPVDRRLRVTTLNFEGDEQSDLSVHGGVDKAVYVYPSEHYEFWRRELPQADLPVHRTHRRTCPGPAGRTAASGPRCCQPGFPR